MQSRILKLSLHAIILIVALSIGMLYSCEDKEIELDDVWVCSDYRYNVDGYLKLNFNDDDGTLLAQNTTTAESLFDALTYNYEIKNDTMLYLTKGDSISLEFIIYKQSENSMKLVFAGALPQCETCPSGEYTFRKK
ncbi:MAG: hypothetical protein ACK5M0_00695 [Bacteroidales bacterium]